MAKRCSARRQAVQSWWAIRAKIQVAFQRIRLFAVSAQLIETVGVSQIEYLVRWRGCDGFLGSGHDLLVAACAQKGTQVAEGVRRSCLSRLQSQLVMPTLFRVLRMTPWG